MFSESASAQAALAYNPAEEQQTAATKMALGAVATDPNPCDPRRVYGGGRPGLRRPQNLWRLAALDRYELARHHHATASRKVGTFRLGAFKKNREYRQDWDEGVAIFRQDDPVDVRIPDLQSFNGTTQFSP